MNINDQYNGFHLFITFSENDIKEFNRLRNHHLSMMGSYNLFDFIESFEENYKKDYNITFIHPSRKLGMIIVNPIKSDVFYTLKISNQDFIEKTYILKETD